MKRGFSPIRHGIPVLALMCLAYAVWVVAGTYGQRVVTRPPLDPPVNPYRAAVAGSGIVEPSSEVLSLAIERGGVVARVEATAGTKVKLGQALFAIDDRNYRGRLAETDAAAAAAAADLASIDQSVIQQRDVIAQAEAVLNSAKAELTRAKLDQNRYAELSRRDWSPRQRYETADADQRKAVAGQAAADAALAGAKRQNEVLAARRAEAVAKLAQARAVGEQAMADLDKTVVRAPIDGTILKVNVWPGEYAAAGMLDKPLMTMGATDVLHVRADIDEADAWRVRAGGAAMARLRGNPAIATTLTFVRFEPYVLPKKTLTDSTAQRVDTRVLEAIYAYAPGDFPAFVGQQVDVFIETAERAAVTPRPTTGPAR